MTNQPETAFVVRLIKGDTTWFLKRTAWTMAEERAGRFASEGEAMDALENAKRFMARKTDARRAEIMLLSSAQERTA